MNKSKTFPTLLNKTDAMLYAADMLDRMVSDVQLLSLFKQVYDKLPPEAPIEVKRRTEEFRRITAGIVDADLQGDAMRAAAAEIRSMAHETKLAEARAAANGIQV
ncbi:hypothetical protein K32_24520 [Kaistia sp. 32K]|uniref:hypothetical protein n=1 Tax=Kaistia sp. 32K TaxID=2795690 RepID=UPI001915BCF1|nr:hypothetical protein [Kaistia sp. 32K]BCP53835.1 hypothetical protein K32_24520 [Kaistia sp. 32K]